MEEIEKSRGRGETVFGKHKDRCSGLAHEYLTTRRMKKNDSRKSEEKHRLASVPQVGRAIKVSLFSRNPPHHKRLRDEESHEVLIHPESQKTYSKSKKHLVKSLQKILPL